MRRSQRGAINPFVVMDVLRKANQLQEAGRSVLHLEMGQPTDPAPSKVLQVASHALTANGLGYTEALGLPSLRHRIVDYYRTTQNAAVPAPQVAVTTGSSGGFLLAFTAAFDPGDRVVLAAPGYPAYRNILQALNIEVVEVPVGPDSHWQLTAQHLQALPGRIDGVIVANPANPTGSMLTQAQLQELVTWCETHDVRLVSDEIYHGIHYHQPAVTAWGMGEHVIVINSFSKYFGMTGWRIGWMLVPADLLRAVECLQQNMFISAPTLSQLAAEVAFDCLDELDSRVARYAANRRILLDGLAGLGFDQLAPSDGAFYVYADVTRLTNDASDFCSRLLTDTGVATTPGVDFDPLRGHHTMRFSFAGATGDMDEAVRRLRGWL